MSDITVTLTKSKKSDAKLLNSNKPKAKLKKKETSKCLKDYIFTETVQTLNSSAFGFGYLPVNSPWVKLLVLGGYGNQRQPSEGKIVGRRITSHYYRVEPQLQLNLFEKSKTFLAKSQLFLRFQYDIIDNLKVKPTAHNLTTELSHKFPGELFVLRFNVSSNNLQDPKTRETKLAVATFFKSPTYSVPILGRIRLRIAPEYTRNFKTKENGLLIHTKVEGDIKKNPWWGWGIQTFWSVNVDRKRKQRGVDFAGLYLWSGAVLPDNWFGKGFFLEAGIWLGKEDVENGPVPLGKALAMMFNIKLKFGTECRWWQ